MVRLRDPFTLPNALTGLRLLLVPFIVWQLAEGELLIAFWLFAIAAITDFFDGGLARWLDQRSVVGAWLDPIADKTLYLSTLLMLVWLDVLPVWLGWLVLVRDAIVLLGALAFRAMTGALKVAPTLWGKLTTAVEFLLVAIALADLAFGWGYALLSPLIMLTGLLVAISGLHYMLVWAIKALTWRREDRGL